MCWHYITTDVVLGTVYRQFYFCFFTLGWRDKIIDARAVFPFNDYTELFFFDLFSFFFNIYVMYLCVGSQAVRCLSCTSPSPFFQCTYVFVWGEWDPNIVLHICIIYGGILPPAENAYTKWFIWSTAFLVESTAIDGDEQESESQIPSLKVTITHMHCNIAEQNQAQQCMAILGL